VKLVAGLGNPGPRYADSRHNVGFGVVDELAARWGVPLTRYDRDFEALVSDCQVHGQRVLLLKPQTYMNLSGRSVLAAQQFYKLALSDLLIVCDDLALPLGRIRLRAGGSGGGQKGLENVLLRLGNTAVPRLRIGIGQVPSCVASEYVLGRFAPAERPQIAQAIRTAADAVECWLREGIDTAMNRFNPAPGSRPAGPDAAPPGAEAKGEVP